MDLGNMLREMFISLDGVIGFCIRIIYKLIFEIANVNVFGNHIYEFMGRIYTFLGIFMLFKLSFSVLSYIINPDSLNDKSKGFGKLITNVIIVLILIVTVPTLFKEAFKLQGMLLKQNVIYSIITGQKMVNTTDQFSSYEQQAEESGYMLAYSVYSSFIYSVDEKGKISSAKISAYTLDFLLIKINIEGGDDYSCDKMISNPKFSVKFSDNWIEMLKETTDLYDRLNKIKSGKNMSYEYAYECILDASTVTAKKTGITTIFGGSAYLNEYKFFISTIIGIFVAYMLASICISTAIRTIKLGMLQIIAPIPIISMIDPNSGKNGMFSKWLKECGKTFADLFIRLAGVFFAVEIIQWVTINPSLTYYTTGESIADPFVNIMIILGALIFAKQLPQFIESITGIKLDGGGFNLKKQLGAAVGLGAVAGGAALVGKKAIAGVDSARHGKGFWNGTKNVQGNGAYSKLKKGWDSITPNRAKQATERKEGKEELKQMHKRWEKGDELYDEYGGNAFSGADNDQSYNVFKHDDFKNSKRELDKAEADFKVKSLIYNQKYAAGNITQEEIEEYGKAQKSLEGKQKTHDIMRKTYSDDAYIEDAYKFRKYNSTDPTTFGNTGSSNNEPNNDRNQTVEPTQSPTTPQPEVRQVKQDTTVTTPGGSQVHYKKGDQVTKGGIILNGNVENEIKNHNSQQNNQ